MEHTSSATAVGIGTGLSANVDPILAAEQVCEEVTQSVEPGQVDLAFVFASGAHADDLEMITQQIGQGLAPATLLGVSAESVVGTGVELEGQTGLSLFAASLPGTMLQTFTYRELPHIRDERDLESIERAAVTIGAAPDLRAVFIFADPFSVPAASVIEGLSLVPGAVPGLKRCPILGGMASASSKPGGNALVVNGHVMKHGGVGVSVRGDVEIDHVVSQGCRPVGAPMVVTEAQRNVIKALGGRRAIDVLRELVGSLEAEDRELLTGGLFLGRVIDEYKSRFGRGDFLIRSVLGVDQQSGAIAIGDVLRVGQTVQFHVRDAQTAKEDLELLLGAQKLQTPPLGGLLFTCNGRGSSHFGEPNHDAERLSHGLAADDQTPMPLGGFFAAGEIGPIGGRSFLHGHTACAALIRPRPLSAI